MQLTWKGDKPAINTEFGDVYLCGPSQALSYVVDFLKLLETDISVHIAGGEVHLECEEALQTICALKDAYKECQDKLTGHAAAAGVALERLQVIRDKLTSVLRLLWENPSEAQTMVEDALADIGAVEETLGEVD